MVEILQQIVAVVTLILAPFPATPTGLSEPQAVTLTAYTCETHPSNPMNVPGMCLATAYGNDPLTIGVACPPAWRGRTLLIEGFAQYGAVDCDDTGKYDEWRGLPHLDLRVATVDEANQIGIQTVWIRFVE